MTFLIEIERNFNRQNQGKGHHLSEKKKAQKQLHLRRSRYYINLLLECFSLPQQEKDRQEENQREFPLRNANASDCNLTPQREKDSIKFE